MSQIIRLISFFMLMLLKHTKQQFQQKLYGNCIRKYKTNNNQFIQAIVNVSYPNVPPFIDKNYNLTTQKNGFISLDFDKTIKRWDWNISENKYFIRVEKNISNLSVVQNAMIQLNRYIIIAFQQQIRQEYTFIKPIYYLRIYDQETLKLEYEQHQENFQINIEYLAISNNFYQNYFIAGGRNQKNQSQGIFAIYQIQIQQNLSIQLKQFDYYVNEKNSDISSIYQFSILQKDIIAVGYKGNFQQIQYFKYFLILNRIFQLNITNIVIPPLFSNESFSLSNVVLSMQFNKKKNQLIVSQDNGYIIIFNISFVGNIFQMEKSKVFNVTTQNYPIYKILLFDNYEGNQLLLISQSNFLYILDVDNNYVIIKIVNAHTSYKSIISFCVVDDFIISGGEDLSISESSISLNCTACNEVEIDKRNCSCLQQFKNSIIPLQMIQFQENMAICQSKQCQTNCTCNDSQQPWICSICQIDYFLQKNENNCQKCSDFIPFCFSCQNNFNCSQCFKDKWIHFNDNKVVECLNNCPKDKYSLFGYDIIPKIQENKCVLECPDYLKPSTNYICSKCHSDCKIGMCAFTQDPNACFQCENDSLYLNPRQIGDNFGNCITTNLKCQMTQNAVFVSKEISNIQFNKCMENCPNQSFNNGKFICVTCKELISNCKQCLNSTICIECKQNYYLQLDKKLCLQSCSNGTMGIVDFNDQLNKCILNNIKCPQYQVLDQKSNICSICHDSCNKTKCIYANDETQCTQCIMQSHYLKKSEKQLIYGTCEACPQSSCLKCKQNFSNISNNYEYEIICEKCSNKKFLSLDGKNCVDNCYLSDKTQYNNLSSMVCEQCSHKIKNCLECLTEFSCKKCRPLFFLNNSNTSCNNFCPLGTFGMFNNEQNMHICDTTPCHFPFAPLSSIHICDLCHPKCKSGKCIIAQDQNFCTQCENEEEFLNIQNKSVNYGNCILKQQECTIQTVAGRQGVKYESNKNDTLNIKSCMELCPMGYKVNFDNTNMEMRECIQKDCNKSNEFYQIRFTKNNKDYQLIKECKQCNMKDYYLDEEYELCFPFSYLTNEVMKIKDYYKEKKQFFPQNVVEQFNYNLKKIEEGYNKQIIPKNDLDISIQAVYEGFIRNQIENYLNNSQNDSDIPVNQASEFISLNLSSIKFQVHFPQKNISNELYQIPVQLLDNLKLKGYKKITIMHSNQHQILHYQKIFQKINIPKFSPTLLEFKIYDFDKQNEIQIQNLSQDEKILISLKKYQLSYYQEEYLNSKNNLICVFYNQSAEEWQDEGLEFIDQYDPNSFFCRISHLSLFALTTKQQFELYQNNNKRLIIILSTTIPISTLIVISFIILIKKKRKKRKKDSQKRNQQAVERKKKELQDQIQLQKKSNKELNEKEQEENMQQTKRYSFHFTSINQTPHKKLLITEDSANMVESSEGEKNNKNLEDLEQNVLFNTSFMNKSFALKD